MSFDSVRFGDLFLEPQRNGLTRPKKVRGAGFPMVNMGELFAHPRIQNLSMDLVPVSEREHQFFLKKGDLLFARQSLVLSGAGQCSIFLGNHVDTVFESHLIRCRLDKSVCNPLFYFYFFRSSDGRKLIETIVEQGAGASGIRGSDLVNIKVPFPEKNTQDMISEILSALDDRITLLRETNTTLEAIAQALFKSWFVDFDPVHAKRQGRAPEGMDAQTAALFPDSFEESELGMVPKEWRASNLGEIASFQNGYAFKSKDWQDSGHPVVKIGDVKPGIIDLSGCSFVSPSTLKGLDRFALFRGDLLVGMTGYVGETGLVPSHNPQAFLNQRVGRIAAKNKQACFEYIYCAIRNSGFKEFAVSQSHGSAQANVSGASILEYPIVLACEKIIDAFSGIVKVLIEKILTNHEQALALASCRDTLLPRLISGQLRLPEAQALVEDAVDA